MKIEIQPLKESDLKPLYKSTAELGFCKIFTDRMFVMYYTEVDGWHNPQIKKAEPFMLEPSTIVFHYAQEIFEGLKAFKTRSGEINLFRPEMNAKRFNKSATRMCMPTVPEFDFLEAIEKLVSLEERWIPPAGSGASLYIRPFMFATDTTLGVRASSTYLFCIILSPVGPYYAEGFNPISLYVSDEYVRAAKGGTGDVKTGGNYAASLLAGRVARENGCAQVLWLDAAEHRFVEEVGAMNIFFVFGNKLVTPALTGSILPGITRDSVITLAKDMGMKVEERLISIDEVIGGIITGAVTEIFGSGTAASISPVGALRYKGKDYVVGDRKVGPVSQKLYETLQGIQYGEIEDKYNWIRKVRRNII